MLASIAAWKLGVTSVAIVVGRTVFLHNTTKKQFLQDEQWVRHEVAHVLQYRTLGFFYFIAAYIRETYVNGYFNNRFEVEARSRENDENILSDIRFMI